MTCTTWFPHRLSFTSGSLCIMSGPVWLNVQRFELPDHSGLSLLLMCGLHSACKKTKREECRGAEGGAEAETEKRKKYRKKERKKGRKKERKKGRKEERKREERERARERRERERARGERERLKPKLNAAEQHILIAVAMPQEHQKCQQQP